MKKLFTLSRIIAILLSIFFAVACSDDIDGTLSGNDLKVEVSEVLPPHRIAVKDALSSADRFFANMSGSETRSLNQPRRVASVRTLDGGALNIDRAALTAPTERIRSIRFSIS